MDGGTVTIAVDVDVDAGSDGALVGVAAFRLDGERLVDATQIAPAKSTAHIRYPVTSPRMAANRPRSPVRRIRGNASCPSTTAAGGIGTARIADSTANVSKLAFWTGGVGNALPPTCHGSPPGCG
ncbi:hypothetical protein A4G30_27280 [Mycobacterium kansasii]|nr:hypothetical protein A4G30_27280 [Mycobacterium kansasii]